jgi:hypothetical protein
VYFISEENRAEEDSPSTAACREDVLSRLLKKLMRKIRETVFVPNAPKTQGNKGWEFWPRLTMRAQEESLSPSFSISAPEG